MRVRPAARLVNRSSTSVDGPSSRVGFQLITNRAGGSQARIVPQLASVPSDIRSSTRPPGCFSKTIASVVTRPSNVSAAMLCVASGHQVSRRSVKRAKTSACGRCTTTLFRTGSTARAVWSGIGMVGPPGGRRRLLGGRGEVAERVHPHALDVGAQLGQAGRVGALDAAGALALLGDEAGVAQDTQVLRDGRAA